MTRWLRRIRYALQQQRRHDELAEELRYHRELKQQELQGRGVSPEDARDASHRAIGNDALTMNQARDVWIWPWLQDIVQDVRFAFRMLAKDRRFTLAAVVALGLGIGVNNSVFAIIDATLFRDAPFDRADQLLLVRVQNPRGQQPLSLPELRDLQESARTFQALAGSTGGPVNVSDADKAPERLRGSFVSTNTFGLLRVAPILGRDFRREDDERGAAPVAIIGHGLWMDRYGSDPAIVGRVVKVNNAPTTIIGVMPLGFRYPFNEQMWLPLSQVAGQSEPRRELRTISAIGRLSDSATRAEAQAELESIAARLAQDYPATNKGVRFSVAGLKESVQQMSKPMLGTMMGAVAIVLLIACANLANLLLARSAARQREIAIRASLGATRWRIVRQLLIECSLLAAMAGGLGLWLSYYGARQIAVAFAPLEVGTPISMASTPYWLDLSMSSSIYAFVGALCLLTTLAFGLVPALHVSRTDPHDTLKEGGRTLGGVRARRWTSALMVSELALTLILLSVAGLLWRSFIMEYRADTVVDPSGVVTMQFSLPAQTYPQAEQRDQFMHALDDRLRDMPAVKAIALSNVPPFQIGLPRQVALDGRPLPTDGNPPQAIAGYVTERYFDTLGLSLVQGRMVTRADAEPGREAVVVSQRFVDRFFADGTAIGRRIQLTSATPPSVSPWMTVVGVVPTIPRQFGPPSERSDPAVYAPLQLDPALRLASITVRAEPGGERAVAATLREEVRRLDPDLPLFAVALLTDVIAQTRSPTRLVGTWFSVLALIALIVASVGLFAITAHGVAQRTQEIGVRLALGAQRGQLSWLFLRQTLWQIVIGVLIGLGGALGGTRLLQAYLRDTSAQDPLTLIIVVTLLGAVATAATLLPARRAARIDPVTALRAE